PAPSSGRPPAPSSRPRRTGLRPRMRAIGSSVRPPPRRQGNGLGFLLVLLGDRRFRRLEADLAVGAITERLADRGAAPAECDPRTATRVHLDARRVVNLHVPFDEVRPIRTSADLDGHDDALLAGCRRRPQPYTTGVDYGDMKAAGEVLLVACYEL